jgi:integrase
MAAKIQERGDKVYVVINHGGRRQARYCGRGKAAAKLARKVADVVNAEIKLGRFSFEVVHEPVERPTAPAFAECAKAWPEWRSTFFKARRPNTERNSAAAIKSFGEFRELPVPMVTREVIREYIKGRKAAGLGDQTIRIYLVTLKSILDYAVEKGHVGQSPMRQGPLWSPGGAAAPDPFDLGELRRLLEAAESIDKRLGLMVRCWAQSGMRSGEIRALRRSDLNLSQGVVRVERTLDHHGRFAPVKTRNSVRTASLLYPTCEPVTSWEPGSTRESRSVLAALAKVTTLDQAAPLFGSLRDATKFMRDTESLKLWAMVLDRSGVRPRVAENLRHSLVSAMLSRGCPPLVLTAQTGHTAAVMFKHYAAFVPGENATCPPPAWGFAGATPRRGDDPLLRRDSIL